MSKPEKPSSRALWIILGIGIAWIVKLPFSWYSERADPPTISLAFSTRPEPEGVDEREWGPIAHFDFVNDGPRDLDGVFAVCAVDAEVGNNVIRSGFSTDADSGPHSWPVGHPLALECECGKILGVDPPSMTRDFKISAGIWSAGWPFEHVTYFTYSIKRNQDGSAHMLAIPSKKQERHWWWERSQRKVWLKAAGSGAFRSR
jgi:hypothetical protein